MAGKGIENVRELSKVYDVRRLTEEDVGLFMTEKSRTKNGFAETGEETDCGNYAAVIMEKVLAAGDRPLF